MQIKTFNLKVLKIILCTGWSYVMLLLNWYVDCNTLEMSIKALKALFQTDDNFHYLMYDFVSVFGITSL